MFNDFLISIYIFKMYDFGYCDSIKSFSICTKKKRTFFLKSAFTDHDWPRRNASQANTTICLIHSFHFSHEKIWENGKLEGKWQTVTYKKIHPTTIFDCSQSKGIAARTVSYTHLRA